MSQQTKYRIELKEPKGVQYKEWKGRATPDRLVEYVNNYHKSLDMGGKNHYITSARGYKPFLISARILTERTGKVVAEWKGYTTMRV